MDSIINKRWISSGLLAQLLMCLLTLGSTQSTSASELAIWDAFNNGEVVALMRHAIAPGNGDPTEFDVDDCNTQRNLSKDGISQAQQVGLQIKESGIEQADVYTSQWCRCLDTATNLNLGTVQKLPMLNSFYQNRSTDEIQTKQLTDWVVDRLSSNIPGSNTDEQHTRPALLVTHQVNITALTGVYPNSGEIVFVAIDNGKLTAVTTWLLAD